MKSKISILIILLVVVALVFVFTSPSSEEGGVEMTIVEMVESGSAALLDVRTDEEREVGYGKGSVHFDYYRMEAGEFPNIDKDAKIYVYCKSGVRAGKAEALLKENGFEDVTNIGGFEDWKAMGGQIDGTDQIDFNNQCTVSFNDCRGACAALEDSGECEADCSLDYQVCTS